MENTYVIGVDSGGTFTDCVAIAADGSVARAKAPSTPSDFSIGVINSVKRVAEELNEDYKKLLSGCVLFAHGTTVATNALLTRNGSKTGYLTTKGHEDAIIIGRTFQKVAGLTEFEVADVANLSKATPIVPRSRIYGLNERIDKNGKIITPLDLDSARRGLDALVAEGVNSVAVCLLWSFIRPDHELAVKELIETEYPQLMASYSHEIAPVIKEYERGASTVVNAYLTRNVASYLGKLRDNLAEDGLKTNAVVMQSSGGVTAIERASSKPVRLLTSGPAGGVVGAKYVGDMLGYRNIVTTDVGGTSFDVGLVVEGEAQFTNIAIFDKFEIAMPVIDVATIGAGGGSIGWLEPDTGILRVGPQSAGAEPGPACYNMGGTQPTVTDANVVLGRINPDYFLGGRRKLDKAASWRAFEPLAAALGMSVPEAAAGVIDIADEHMADLVRRVTIERGCDPRDFVVFAFGGAGPMHAAAYAPAAGCNSILMPKEASEFSAFGIAGSDVMVVEELSNPRTAPFDPEEFNRFFEQLDDAATLGLRQNGVPLDRIELKRFVRLRYRGQVHEVEAPIASGKIGQKEIKEMLENFERIYERKYGHGTATSNVTMYAITFRVHGFGRLIRPELAIQPLGAPDASAAVKTHRDVYYRSTGGFTRTPIYDGELLRPGHCFQGPAIIESVDTTAVIHPGQDVSIDASDNVLVKHRDVASS